MKTGDEAALRQILKDCGCAREVIAACLKEKSSDESFLPFFNRQRYILLEKIHSEQKKHYIFDYVIFKLKQGGLKNV